MDILKFIMAFLIGFHAFSQTSIDFGYADPEIPELSQFEYYRGVWKSTLEMRQDDGTFKKLDVVATIKGKFLEDHRTFQTQFTTPNGFFSTDIRTFNIEIKKWKALFLNSKSQRWHEFTSSLVDDKMTTIVIGGYSGKEEFDIKVVDTIISDLKYLKNVYYSYDDLKTWELVYKIEVNKQ